MPRGKDRLTHQSSLSSKTVTEFSEGKAVKPANKAKRTTKPENKNSKVTTTKANPLAMQTVKELQKQYPGSKVTVNKDGTVTLKNK